MCSIPMRRAYSILQQKNSPIEEFTSKTESYSDDGLKVSESVPGSQQKVSAPDKHTVARIHPKGNLDDGGGVEEDQLAREQRALDALVESREREELVAQRSRERMNKMVSAEELAQVRAPAH